MTDACLRGQVVMRSKPASCGSLGIAFLALMPVNVRLGRRFEEAAVLEAGSGASTLSNGGLMG